MASDKEITSTEKLLGQIRGENHKPLLAPDDIGPTPALTDSSSPDVKISSIASEQAPSIGESPQKKKSFLPKLSPVAQKITIGIDIDISNNEIRLAKIEQNSEQNWRLINHQTVPYEHGILKESPEFSILLKKALTKFCQGSNKDFNIWSNIPSAHVEVRYLRIPKVPRKQLARTVQFAFRKEVPFEEKNDLFDFEILGGVTESGVQKNAVLAYTANRSEIQSTKDLFAQCGFPLTGISIVPFAIQNLLRTAWIKEDASAIVCNLYIGTDWSRIDIFNHGTLVVMRGVKSGLNSMTEAIIDELNAKIVGKTSPTAHYVEDTETAEPDFDLTAGVDLEITSANDEENELVPLAMEDDSTSQHPVTADEAHKILFSLSPDSPPLSKDDAGFDLSRDEICEMTYPAVERLVRQIERTFQHFSSGFHGETVSKIYISGKMDLSGHLTEYMARQLGIQGETINPFSPDSPFSKGISAPRSFFEKLSLGPAIGLALSNNSRTPNFLYTHADKSKKATISKFDRVVFIVFIVAISICITISLWQNQQVKEKNQKLTQLEQQLELFRPEPNKDLIINMATKVGLKRQGFRRYAKRYRGMAAISEVSALTPSNVSLLKSGATFPLDSDKNGVLALEGIISGKRRILEASLASYILKLASSPLFEQPKVQKSVIEPDNGSDVLHFIVHIQML